MTSKYVWIGLAVGLFLAGLGLSYAVFINTYNPYAMMGNPAMFNNMMGNNPQFSSQYMGYMMQNPQYMNQWMSQNPQYVGQWMGSMMQDPQLRQQMIGQMYQNQGFMQQMMQDPQYVQQMKSFMKQNPQVFNQCMGIMMQDPELAQSMMGQMLQNPQFMHSMMQNPQFQKQGFKPMTPSIQPNQTGVGPTNTSPGFNMGPEMMGGGSGYGGSGSNYGMGSMMNTPTSTIDNSTFNALNSQQSSVIVNRTSNTVYVGSTGVTVPVEASPLWHPQPGDYWLVYGLANPTIVIKQGEQVNFLFINMDNDTHVASITTMAPPYSYMPMMNGMMGGGTQNAAVIWLAISPMLPGVTSTTSNQNVTYSDAVLTVTFNNRGTFWYPCLYPGHAQDGMYGKIIVQ